MLFLFNISRNVGDSETFVIALTVPADDTSITDAPLLIFLVPDKGTSILTLASYSLLSHSRPKLFT